MVATTTPTTIAGLEPAAVWKFFAGIAGIPRPSKQEERIRKHILEVAGQHGLSAHEDAQGNVIVDVPATKGHESAPITVLQGHLDMVCEKNAGTEHDFDREPIQLVKANAPGSDEPIVRANGTTLGADNGIGVALALAAATSDNVVHGPLELLFTLDEEAGMSGAKALTPDAFKGRRLLNLDSEEDDSIYIGCAGGCDTTVEWVLGTNPAPPDTTFFEILVTGLRGGHSGGDIHEGRASAIKLLARTLAGVKDERWQLVSIEGGRVRNAIPREASAIICSSYQSAAALEAAAKRVRAEAIAESGDEGAQISVAPLDDDPPPGMLTEDDSRRICSVLAALPHGVLGLHPKVPGLVETSNNISTIQSIHESGAGHEGDQSGSLRIAIGLLSRSSCVSRLHEALSQIAAIGRLAGATVTHANEYAGWDPNPDSATLAKCRKVYRELFGAEPQVRAIHAGLECGVIGERIPGMDMVSFGPRIEGAHSPDEHVYVRSVAKSWEFLKAVLAELARA